MQQARQLAIIISGSSQDLRDPEVSRMLGEMSAEFGAMEKSSTRILP